VLDWEVGLDPSSFPVEDGRRVVRVEEDVDEGEHEPVALVLWEVPLSP
jgi:hypothetical protein